MKGFFIFLHIIVCFIVIISVLMQPAKVTGLSKTLSGGVGDTFFGKNKSRTYEGKLKKVTTISMIIFVITSMALIYFTNR